MSCMGIDVGIYKVAIFLVGEEPDGWTFEAPSDRRDMQLGELGAICHDFALMHRVDYVWIEDTIIGNNRKYSIKLAETKGAIMADLATVRMQQGTDIRLVDNKTWKKQVVGNGNATKDMVRDYIHSTHPQYAPICGQDEDLYDACCIGLYGALVTTRAEHLQL